MIASCRARVHNWICNACNYKESTADPARYMAHKLANSLRYHGAKGPYPGTAFVRQLLNKYPVKNVKKWFGCIT